MHQLRILVVGGYGVFGGRLCQLLCVDSRLDLLVAGRSLAKAESFCRDLAPGAKRAALVFDRDGDLGEQFARLSPQLVIDATGPFQDYGDQPYRLVEACIDAGIDYMDFADGSDFVQGIERFDAGARERGLYVLSGVSSFPVLTAAVVRKLSAGMSRVRSIRGGIAPSPLAGVGPNVIRAIATYAGKPVRLWRDGRPARGHALVETLRYTVAPPGRLPLHSRLFSLVDVPDLRVLPPLWPGLESVWMGAGPVPEFLHRMLVSLAWLVRLRLLPTIAPLSPLFHRAITRLGRGEHRGGMFVEVGGEGSDGANTTHSWHLLAEGDDGPFIPCMAPAALIERALSGRRPMPGARPATGELELEDFLPWFQRRQIFLGRRESVEGQLPASVFESVLGAAWQEMPAPLRDLHGTGARWSGAGRATVERGRGLLARLAAGLFRFPLAGEQVPVSVDIERGRDREYWTRDFAGRRFTTELTAGQGRSERLLCERFGPLTFAIALVRDGDRLLYVVRRWLFLGIPLPRRWAPAGVSFEHASDDRFGFDIAIGHPLTGPIVRYRGWLLPTPIS